MTETQTQRPGDVELYSMLAMLSKMMRERIDAVGSTLNDFRTDGSCLLESFCDYSWRGVTLYR